MVKDSTNHLLFKELIRTVKQYWKQLISIVAISFLSICLFCGLTSNAKNLEERRDYLYEQTNFADVYLTTTSISFEDEQFIRSINEIIELDKRIYINGTSNKNTVYLVSPEVGTELSLPLISQGEEGFLLVNSYAEANHINIGDEVEISFSNLLLSLFDGNEATSSLIENFLSSYVLENKANIIFADDIILKFNVTGFMYHPEGVQTAEFSPSLFYVDRSVLSKSIISVLEENYDTDSLIAILKAIFPSLSDQIELFFEFTDLSSFVTNLLPYISNQILIKSSSPSDTVNKINEYYQQKGDNSTLLTCSLSSELQASKAINQDVNQAMQLTFVFPVIFFLVSLLVILTTLSQMIIKQRSQIGVLKALGVKRISIYFHYILYGVVLCFIGCVLGFITGPLLIPKVMGIKYDILWDLPYQNVHFFYFLSILMCVLMILISACCTFLVSYKVIKESPVETLKGENAKISFKVKDSKKFSSKFISLKMALRNIFIGKGKSLMVLLGMMGCTALLVCGFGIMDTLNYDVELDYTINQTIDVLAIPSSNPAELKRQLETQEEVYWVDERSEVPVLASTSNSVDSSLYIIPEESKTFNVPFYVDGGVSVDSHTASQLNLSLGDEIKLYFNNQTFTRKVTNIFETSTIHGIFDIASSYPGVNFDISMFYILLNDGYSIDDFARKLRDTSQYLSVQTIDDLFDYADNLLSSIGNMTDVIKIFAILLCVVVIYNLTSLNVSERKRDIATMKVLGFRFYEISKTLTYEIMLDTLVGIIFGLLLGYPLMVLVLMVNQTDLLTFVYHIKPLTYFIGFAVAFFSSLIVSLLLNLKAKKINMTESLKSIE